jgi:asparagine synthase (glutamine-hydrolysing)
MSAPDRVSVGAADERDRPYQDWLAVVSRRGAVELIAGGDDGANGAGTYRSDVARQGPCSAFFDGLLYNRAELVERLGLRDATDSELALHAYLRSGDDALRELSGIYALVVGDRGRERAICARDRVGSYPLFYVDAGGELLLSTSIDVLLRDPRVSSEVNRGALADHLAHRWPDPGETYYAAIRRVPPGHALLAEPGLTRVSRYWSPIGDDGEVDWVAEDELERFDELLEAAVARFVGLGRTAIYLSGGLDSVSVAAFATEVSRKTGQPAPWALSVGFSHEEANEQSVQRGVASALDLPQLLVPLEEAAGPEGLMAAMLELSRDSPAPVVNMWLPAYNHLALAARERGCRVILSGHGGDEWLTVTPYYAADLILALDLLGVFRLWENERRSYPVPAWTLARNLAWRFGLRPLLGSAAARIAPWAVEYRRRRAARAVPGWIAPDPLLRQELIDRATASLPIPPKPGQIYLSEMNEGLDHALVAMELEEAFEVGRRLGLRFGHPFFDADLLAFLYRTPPELLNRGGRAKGLVRGMLARRFPELGFERQRKVTATAVARTMFVREGEVAWRRMGGATALAALGVIDGAATSAMVETLLSKRGSPEENAYSYRIWDILALEAWVRLRLSTDDQEGLWRKGLRSATGSR